MNTKFISKVLIFLHFLLFPFYFFLFVACRWETGEKKSELGNLQPKITNESVYYAGWGYPRSIEVSNYDSDCQPWVSANGKRIFFVTNNFNGPPRQGYIGSWDIYFADWDSINNRWGVARTAGPNVNTPQGERRPSSTRNGDTLYFGRMGDIYLSTWDGTQWTPAVRAGIPGDSLYAYNNPALSLDGRRLYFDSNRPGGIGGTDIWVARWNGTSWDSLTNLGIPLNTPSTETRPFESGDRQRLYFSNFVSGPRLEGSFGSSDIYVSFWTGSAWGPVSVIGAPVNNDMIACTPYESPNGRNLYIASESYEGSRGEEDIWVASLDSVLTPSNLIQPSSWLKTGELTGAIYVYDLKEGSGGAIYAATGCSDTAPMGKVFKTTNGGITWNEMGNLQGAMLVYSLAVKGDTIYAGTYPAGDVFKSTNGGITFTNTANIPGIRSARSLLWLRDGSILVGASPADTMRNSRVYKTTDGGASWMQMGPLRGLGSPFKFLYQVSTGTIYAGGWSAGPKIWSSTNNGATWDITRLIPSVNGAFSIDGFCETQNGTLYTMGWIHPGAGVGGGYVYKSTNSGASWDTTAKIIRPSGVRAARVYTMAETSSGTIFAGFQPAIDSVVYASSDGGASWYYTGSLAGAFEALCLLKASDGSLYAGTTPNGDVFKYSPTGVEEIEISNLKLQNSKLFQNSPNPFNSLTKIEFLLPKREYVSLKVFDVLGREIRTLVDGETNPGKHSIVFNTKGLSSGVYFYRLTAGKFTDTKKMLLLR